MKKRMLFGFVFALMLFLSIPNTVTKEMSSGTYERNIVQPSSYDKHGPIVISSNQDFTEQGWPGSGTLEDPYLIEGLNITADSPSIQISHTSAHFEIRNCLISGMDGQSRPGVTFYRVEHGNLHDCMIENHSSAASIVACEDCSITNTTAVQNSFIGFEFRSAENCTIENNTVSGTTSYGFFVEDSKGSTFSNNTAVNNSRYGFFVLSKRSCNFFNNSLIGCGFQLEGWQLSYMMHFLSGNMINGKSLKYCKNTRDLFVDASSYGQVILANCSNVTVSNGVFVSGSGGLTAAYCSNCTITNITASSSYTGFTLLESEGCVLNGSSASNTYHGFELDSCDNCTLMNNIAAANSWGFDIAHSDNTTFANNSASENYAGFHVYSSDNNVFTQNSIERNTRGFQLLQSADCTLVNNTFEDDSLLVSGYEKRHWRHDADGNTVNEKDFGYFWNTNHSNINGTAYGQLILANCNGSTVEGGVYENVAAGLQIAYSVNCTLSNIAVYNASQYSYFVFSSHNCTIAESVAISGKGVGFGLLLSSSCVLQNNTANNNTDQGFALFLAEDCVLINNTISNSLEQGVSLIYSDNCTLRDNTFLNNALHISGDRVNWIHTMSGNTINGARLGYFKEVQNMVLHANQFGQIIAVDCNDVTIEDGTLDRTSGGILLAFCGQCTLRQITVIGSSYYGFYLQECISSTLSDNIARDCLAGGFSLRGATGIGLQNNLADSNPGNGFYVRSLTSCTIAGNTASNNTLDGFRAEIINDCTLNDNEATHNSHDGFDIGYSENLLVTRNTASENLKDGFNLRISESNITKNTANHNGKYGIFLDEHSYHNVLFLNRIGFNTEADAMNDGNANSWDNGVFGNYYSNYDGGGSYSIPGTDYSIDRHPYEYYHDYPVINHPPDMSYPSNTTGHSIIWQAWDWEPMHFSIFRGPEIVLAGITTSGRITHNIDHDLSPSTYNFTVLVRDGENHTATDTVFVTVEWPSGYTPGAANLIDMELVLIVVGAVSAVIVAAVVGMEYLEKRNRK